MNINLPSDYARILMRVARAEDGLDVTTLMHSFRQTPAVIAHVSRRLAAKGLITVERTKLRATREGRAAAVRFANGQSARNSEKWRQIPGELSKPKLDPFKPYLPKRSEVDPTLIQRPRLASD